MATTRKTQSRQSRPAAGLPKPKASDLYPQADTLPTLTEVDFATKVMRRVELKSVIDVAEEELEALNSDIEAALILVDQKGVKLDDYVVTRCNGATASKFSIEAAVEKGLDADVLKSCYIAGRQYTYIQIVKEKKEGERTDA